MSISHSDNNYISCSSYIALFSNMLQNKKKIKSCVKRACVSSFKVDKIATYQYFLHTWNEISK